MKQAQKIKLIPLLSSNDGVHLTSYLENRGDTALLKKQLRKTLDMASNQLYQAMPPEDLIKFLQPLQKFYQDPTLLQKYSGNIGIFRKQQSLHILNIPSQVNSFSVLANSFHVKPLLKWMQLDREFFLLGAGHDGLYLYKGNQAHVEFLDRLPYQVIRGRFLHTADVDGQLTELGSRASLMQARHWLQDWLSVLSLNSKPKLFMSGHKATCQKLLEVLDYSEQHREPMQTVFSPKDFAETLSEIRLIMRRQSKQELSRIISMFHYEHIEDLALSNIYTIAEAAVKGKVKQLLVAEDVQIFGRLNPSNGELAIHPGDMDHQDDDLLDDISQTVLLKGGEVAVCARRDMPSQRPILALLDRDYQASQTLSARVYPDRRVPEQFSSHFAM